MNCTFDKRKAWINNSQELGVLIIFFIIWPFGAWLYSAFRCAKTKGAYVIFFLFSLLICWHFAPNNHTGYYDDFIGILDRFKTTRVSTSQLLSFVSEYFAGNDNAEKEIYEVFLNWVTRLFTDNYHLFFLFASIPVALCQLSVMKRLTGDVRFNNGTIIGVILLALFLYPRDIITVQNPRFATGFWLAVLGTVSFYCHNVSGRKYWPALIFILLAPLCHSGLIIYLIIFSVGFFAKTKRWLEIAALVSIPFVLFDAGLFSEISISFLPSSIQAWADRYMSDEYYATYVLNEGKSGFWWVQEAFSISMKFIYVLMTVQLIMGKNTVLNNPEAAALYPFYLVLFTIVNLIQFIPVLGGRYYWFIQVFCVFVWFKAFGFTKKNMLLYLLAACSFGMLKRYGYVLGGALSVTTNPDLFFMPLPYLITTGFTK